MLDMPLGCACCDMICFYNAKWWCVLLSVCFFFVHVMDVCVCCNPNSPVHVVDKKCMCLLVGTRE